MSIQYDTTDIINSHELNKINQKKKYSIPDTNKQIRLSLLIKNCTLISIILSLLHNPLLILLVLELIHDRADIRRNLHA